MKAKVHKNQLNALLEILSEKLKEPRNSEIRESLRRMLDNADLKDLRDIMRLSGYKSVDYSFIQEDILRTQLEVDNLRMEDAACSTQIKNEEERFFIYCINAFYQIENLTNYYFVKMFPEFPKLLEHLEKNSNFKHKEDPITKEIREKSVGDIDISCKIYALTKQLFPSSKEQPDYTYKTITGLRLVRNEGFHRCQIEETEPNKTLDNFYRYNDFSSIRELLRKYANAILKQIELINKDNQSAYNYIKLPGYSSRSIIKERIDLVKWAKLSHFPAKDGKKDYWKIVVSDGVNTVYFNAHESFFVEKYGLHDNDDMKKILPNLRFYYAINKDYLDSWIEAKKAEDLDPSDYETKKRFHIIEMTEIIRE